MKYKILLLSMVFSAMLSTAAFAQEKKSPELSVNVYGGYGLLTPHADFFTDITSYYTGAFHNIKYGKGAGAHFGAGLSLKLNDNISVGLDADYLTGSKSGSNNTNGDTVKVHFTAKHSVISLIPNVSFKLYAAHGYSIYNTIGIITGLKTKFEIASTTQAAKLGANTQVGYSVRLEKYNYGVNIGFQDAFGVRFHLTKNISAFGQITGYYLPINPKSDDINTNTTFDNNGTPSNSTFIQHVIYKSGNNAGYSYQIESSGGTTRVTAETYPQSQRIFGIGVNAGIILDLHK